MIFTVSISDMIAETNLDSSFLFIQFILNGFNKPQK